MVLRLNGEDHRLRPTEAARVMAELSAALNLALEERVRVTSGSLIITPENSSEWDQVVANLDLPPTE